MVAMAVFFIATFSILELVSRNLKMARAVQQTFIDPAILASELSLTNALEEGTESGDFGDLYPGATWTRDTKFQENATNDLFEVTFVVFEPTGSGGVRTNGLTMLLYKPQSTVVNGGAATLRRGGGR